MSTTPKLFTYGIAPGVFMPLDFPQWIRRFDVHAVYRRPSFDTQGNRLRDVQGRPAWDESVVPCRDHFRAVEKGFEFVGPFVDAPDELRELLEAANATGLLPPTPAAVGA